MRDLEETRYDGDVTHEVTEAKGGKGKLHIFRGIVSQADKRNGNDRVYPRKVLEGAISDLSERLDGGTFGEADHPEGRPSVTRVAGIHRKIWMEANGTVMGESVIPETAMGKDLIAIAKAGGKIGISTRGRGSVRTENWDDGKPAEIIEDDYEMKTWDFVVNQSEKTAMVSELIREHLESKDSGEPEPETQEIKESTMKTVEEFREKHPDLYKTVREECLDSLKGEFEEEVTKQIETKVAEIKATMEEDVKASTTALIAESMAVPVAALITIAGVLTEAGIEIPKETVVEGSAEANEAFESLKAQNAKLNEAVTLIAEKLTTRETETSGALIEAHIEKSLKDVAHADIIREGLKNLNTTDEVDEAIKVEQARIAKIVEASTTKGESKTDLNEDGEGSQGTEAEAIAAQRRLAGV